VKLFSRSSWLFLNISSASVDVEAASENREVLFFALKKGVSLRLIKVMEKNVVTRIFQK
jgi:hypothetical protein